MINNYRVLYYECRIACRIVRKLTCVHNKGTEEAIISFSIELHYPNVVYTAERQITPKAGVSQTLEPMQLSHWILDKVVRHRYSKELKCRYLLHLRKLFWGKSNVIWDNSEKLTSLLTGYAIRGYCIFNEMLNFVFRDVIL